MSAPQPTAEELEILQKALALVNKYKPQNNSIEPSKTDIEQRENDVTTLFEQLQNSLQGTTTNSQNDADAVTKREQHDNLLLTQQHNAQREVYNTDRPSQQQYLEQSDYFNTIGMNPDLRENLTYITQRAHNPADGPILSVVSDVLRHMDLQNSYLYTNYNQSKYNLQQEEYYTILNILDDDRQAALQAITNNDNMQRNNNNNRSSSQYTPSIHAKAKISHVQARYKQYHDMLVKQHYITEMYLTNEVYSHYAQLFQNTALLPATHQPMFVSFSIPERAADYSPQTYYTRAKRPCPIKALFQQTTLRPSAKQLNTTIIQHNNNNNNNNNSMSNNNNNNTPAPPLASTKIVRNTTPLPNSRGTVTHLVQIPLLSRGTPQYHYQHDINDEFAGIYKIPSDSFIHDISPSNNNNNNNNNNANTTAGLLNNNNQYNNTNTSTPQPDLTRGNSNTSNWAVSLGFSPTSPTSPGNNNNNNTQLNNNNNNNQIIKISQQPIALPKNITNLGHYIKQRYGLSDYTPSTPNNLQYILHNYNFISANQNTGNPVFHLRLNLLTPQPYITMPLPLHVNIVKLYFQHTYQDLALEHLLSNTFTKNRTTRNQHTPPAEANRRHLYDLMTKLLQANQRVALPLYERHDENNKIYHKQPFATNQALIGKVDEDKSELYLQYKFHSINDELLAVQSNKLALAMSFTAEATPNIQQKSKQHFEQTKIIVQPNNNNNPYYLAPVPHFFQAPASSSVNDLMMMFTSRIVNHTDLSTSVHTTNAMLNQKTKQITNTTVNINNTQSILFQKSTNVPPGKVCEPEFTISNEQDKDYQQLTTLLEEYTMFKPQDLERFRGPKRVEAIKGILKNNRENFERLKQLKQLYGGDYEKLIKNYEYKSRDHEVGCDWGITQAGIGSYLRIKYIPKRWLDNDNKLKENTVDAVFQNNTNTLGLQQYRGIYDPNAKSRNNNTKPNLMNINNDISIDLWNQYGGNGQGGGGITTNNFIVDNTFIPQQQLLNETNNSIDKNNNLVLDPHSLMCNIYQHNNKKQNIHGCGDLQLLNDDNTSMYVITTTATSSSQNKQQQQQQGNNNTTTSTQSQQQQRQQTNNNNDNNTEQNNTQQQLTLNTQQLQPVVFLTLPNTTSGANPMLHQHLLAATSQQHQNQHYTDICTQAVALDAPLNTNIANLTTISEKLQSVVVDSSMNNNNNNFDTTQQQKKTTKDQQQQNQQQPYLCAEVETHISEVNHQYIDIPLANITTLADRVLYDYTQDSEIYIDFFDLLCDLEEAGEEYISLIKHCNQFLPSTLGNIVPVSVLQQVEGNNNKNGNSNNNNKNLTIQDELDNDEFIMTDFDMLLNENKTPTTNNNNNNNKQITKQQIFNQQLKKYQNNINIKELLNNIINKIIYNSILLKGDNTTMSNHKLLHNLPLFSLNPATISPNEYLQQIEQYAFFSLQKTKYIQEYIEDYRLKHPELSKPENDPFLYNSKVTPEQRAEQQRQAMQLDPPQIFPPNDPVTKRWKSIIMTALQHYQQDVNTTPYENDEIVYYHTILNNIDVLKTAQQNNLKLQSPFVLQFELFGPIQLNGDPVNSKCYENYTIRKTAQNVWETENLEDDDDNDNDLNLNNSDDEQNDNSDDDNNEENDFELQQLKKQLFQLIQTANQLNAQSFDSYINDDQEDNNEQLTQRRIAIEQQIIKRREQRHEEKLERQKLREQKRIEKEMKKKLKEQSLQQTLNECCEDHNDTIHEEEIDEFMYDDYIDIKERLTLLMYRYIQFYYNNTDIDRITNDVYIPIEKPAPVPVSSNNNSNSNDLPQQFDINNNDINNNGKRPVHPSSQHGRILPPPAASTVPIGGRPVQQQSQNSNNNNNTPAPAATKSVTQTATSTGSWLFGAVSSRLSSLATTASSTVSTFVQGEALQNNTNTSSSLTRPGSTSTNNNNNNTLQSQQQRNGLMATPVLFEPYVFQQQTSPQQKDYVQTLRQLAIPKHIPSFTPLHVVMNTRYNAILATNIIKLIPILFKSGFVTSPASSSSSLFNNQKQQQAALLSNPILLSKVLISLSQHSSVSYIDRSLDDRKEKRSKFLTVASNPSFSFLVQNLQQELQFITKQRIYEPYFTLCLTCRIPSVCPSCSMRCHREHRQVLFDNVLNARYYVRLAQALTELHQFNFINLPLEWRWGSNNINLLNGEVDIINEFLTSSSSSSPNNNNINSNNNNIDNTKSTLQYGKKSIAKYAPITTLSTLAITTYVILQYIHNLPQAYQFSILQQVFPFFTTKYRAMAYLLPDWVLYEEWQNDVLYHRGAIDWNNEANQNNVVNKASAAVNNNNNNQQQQQSGSNTSLPPHHTTQQKNQFGFVYNQSFYSDVHLPPALPTVPTQPQRVGSPAESGYILNNDNMLYKQPMCDISYKHNPLYPQPTNNPSSTPQSTTNLQQQQQYVQRSHPYHIQRCLCDKNSAWPSFCQSFSKNNIKKEDFKRQVGPDGQQQRAHYIYNEYKLNKRRCAMTPYNDSPQDFALATLFARGSMDKTNNGGGGGGGGGSSGNGSNTNHIDTLLDSQLDSPIVVNPNNINNNMQQQQQQILNRFNSPSLPNTPSGNNGDNLQFDVFKQQQGQQQGQPLISRSQAYIMQQEQLRQQQQARVSAQQRASMQQQQQQQQQQTQQQIRPMNNDNNMDRLNQLRVLEQHYKLLSPEQQLTVRTAMEITKLPLSSRMIDLAEKYPVDQVINMLLDQ